MGALYVQYMDHTEGSSKENGMKGDIFEIYIKKNFRFGGVEKEKSRANKLVWMEALGGKKNRRCLHPHTSHNFPISFSSAWENE